MSDSQERKISLEEFYRMREETNQLLEYVDGVVFMSPSPSTAHQRISGKLHAELFNYLEGKECEVFSAPYDIQLHRDDLNEDLIFIPDISVICDKKGFQDSKYVGVPALIMEILSPSNQSHDLVVKMEAFMKYGVKEYWIINPMLEVIQIYNLNDSGVYEQTEVMKEKGTIQSKVLEGFEVKLGDVFT
ncbi:Endonuclease, Uma2 family (restriction endonuclease fold) [Oceanobacillus limi]|uniref:Endonuclease, Uma2 family (Restriction endonuclease fold) n=1 Tax=Oceanobacillus limi TaxID=930131 RepID=A0A1I0BJG3_9BACI|nr:Uma2 family endonuclease [Oceanobacillus limi]SET07134.1 Endonuclease, Uma2 family (restriction endonuclease fold) [Oceanobacillus limi]